MGILNKFAPDVTVLEIEYRGEMVPVALVVPSFLRWQEIMAMVPAPAVPFTGPGKTKNTDDPDYVQAGRDAEQRRRVLLVAEALHAADGFDVAGVEKNELPGRTLDERADGVEQLNPGVVNAVYMHLMTTLNPEARRREFEARAESFQRDPGADHGAAGEAGHQD